TGSWDEPVHGVVNLGFDIALDSQGRPTVIGITTTDDFPTLDAIQSMRGGEDDAFVTRLTTTGALSYSSYYRGSDKDFAWGLAMDPRDNVVITGDTVSTD